MSDTKAYRDQLYATYATHFQGTPTQFDASAAREWGAAYREFFRGWLPTDHTAPVLDVACGNGKFLFHLRELGYERLHGVDISAEQVALSRQVVPDVVEGNALDYLALHEERFDLITALDVIEHMTKDELLRFLDLGIRALRPGGRIIIQTPNGASPWAGAVFSGDLTHEVMLSPGLLGKLLTSAGYQNAEAREMGPSLRGRGARTTLRYLVWSCFRAGMRLWNLAEAGSSERVLTRVFCISARKA